MDDLDKFLNQGFNQLPEFEAKEKPKVHRGNSGRVLVPDTYGCIYEVLGLCGHTMDMTETFEEAVSLCKNGLSAWSFFQIWQIHVETGGRILVGQQTRQAPNRPFEYAFLTTKGYHVTKNRS